jgi:RNA polymerase sigma-70 factor (ECF subfamily)
MSGPLYESALRATYSSEADCLLRTPQEEVVDLFDLTRDKLLRYLLTFGLPIADCEELLQESFLALFRHLQLGRPRENLRGWLFRVAHNLALKKRQRSRRHPEHLPLLIYDPVQVPSLAPSPEEECFHRQAHQRLQGVLGALSEMDRGCLILRAEGLTYREISSILDIGLGSVSLSLSRSLAKMARAIEVVSR